MNDATPKQQIVDRIKNVTNILVTVSKNPSVDELSAAIGLTLMLNKLDKHATAVFSGQIPPAITFLEPDKTLENTVDSLRDFIIALDKEKADRLRYRVEDDVVRIFITPYRTKISENDLEFTHGDFNVELVLALGVENQDELDDAIAAHGKILHDATVATFSAQNKKSNLGSIDWQDTQASSLSEMLVAISESIKGEGPLLDEQIATALLTGIVSATDRFSNSQTSPKAMTMAAQLMAAGANQQLIAARLEETQDITPGEPKKSNGELTENTSEKIRDAETPEEAQPPEETKSQDLGEMSIDHERESSADETAEETSPDDEQVSVDIENQDEQKSDSPTLGYVPSATIEEHDRRAKKQAGEEALDAALSKLNAVSPPSTLEQELQQAAAEEPTASLDTGEKVGEPSIGGTFSATAEEAAEAKRREEESSRNKIIMSHGGQVQVPEDHEQAWVSTKGPTLQPVSTDGAAPSQTLADIEQQVHTQPAPEPALPEVDHADTARQEINNLFDSSVAINPPLPTIPSPSSSDQVAPVLPPPPPLPDFSTLPPLPGATVSETPQSTASVATTPQQPQAPPLPPAPDQFRIPGA